MFHNCSVCRSKQQAPFQLFTGQAPTWDLYDFRVFGSPAYVLHKCLQDGDHLNKWQTRSWRGIYVGPSTQHASNVPLIYNPSKTHVTPQYHIVHDEGFTSVQPAAPHIQESIMKKLLEKAQWMHSTIKHPAEPHCHFDNFWSETPKTEPPPHRKYKQPPIDNFPTLNIPLPIERSVSGTTIPTLHNGEPVSGSLMQPSSSPMGTSVSAPLDQPVSGNGGKTQSMKTVL
jgi:hypothetical protein